MKLYFKVPGGAELTIEKEDRQPMNIERFHSIVNLIGGYGVGIGILLLARIIAGCA